MPQGLITPPMITGLGFGTYVFFAAFCLLALVWVWFFMYVLSRAVPFSHSELSETFADDHSSPETNGRTLEQMDFVFGDNQTGHEKERRARIEKAMMENVDTKVEHDLGTTA